jgi:hypothetical protein
MGTVTSEHLFQNIYMSMWKQRTMAVAIVIVKWIKYMVLHHSFFLLLRKEPLRKQRVLRLLSFSLDMILVYITPAFENRFASNAIPTSGLYVSKIRNSNQAFSFAQILASSHLWQYLAVFFLE